MANKETKHILDSIKADKEYEKKIKVLYDSTRRKIEKELLAFMAMFGGDESVNMQRARKRVTSARMNEFYNEVDYLLNEQEATERAKQEVEDDIAMRKRNEIELAFATIAVLTVLMADKEIKMLSKRLELESAAEIKRQSKIIGKTLTPEQIREIATRRTIKGWHTVDFSENVWANQKHMKSELENVVRRVLINGENPRKASKTLVDRVNKEFKNKTYAAERIARTESAAAQTIAQYESYKEFGYEEYQFHAEVSACDLCSELDDEVFKVTDMQIGLNAPFIHPNCKCSTSAYTDREAWDKKLKARGL